MIDNVVASDQWGQLIFYDEWNTLELKWLPTSSDATEAQARGTMALFAAEATVESSRGVGFPETMQTGMTENC